MSSFVSRELDRIGEALRDPRLADHREKLYSAQQALSGRLNPTDSSARTTQLWALLQTPEIVRLLSICLCLNVFIPVWAESRDHLYLGEGRFSDVVHPFASVDFPDNLLLGFFQRPPFGFKPPTCVIRS